MPRLRERLQAESPELFASLIRSWEIAQKEWLSAVKPSEGSYNSLPHFTNIEQHLDSLLGAAAESAEIKLRLSPLEVYLLLASVLFHDIGRVQGNDNHATTSARLLPLHFAALGIPTLELAASLARIALYHDPLRKQDKEDTEHPQVKKNRKAWAKAALRDVRFEPFGMARELYVATLLALADHMDGSVMRSVPRYVTSDEEIGFKGAFRRMVSGTGYDPSTYTIKTTLSGFDPATQPYEKYFNLAECYKHFRREIRDKTGSERDISSDDASDAEGSCRLFDHLVETCHESVHGRKPSKMFRICLAAGNMEPNEQHVIKRKAPETRPGTNEPVRHESVWPADNTLAMVLNDLGANRKFLKEVQGELYEMGLPVDDWFVEFQSEVYDDRGERVSEPMLDDALLLRVVREMRNLRRRLLTRDVMTYEILADSLRLENVALVRLAVRRFANRFGTNWIFAGTTGWSFRVENNKREQRFDDSMLLGWLADPQKSEEHARAMRAASPP